MLRENQRGVTGSGTQEPMCSLSVVSIKHMQPLDTFTTR